MTGKRKMGTVYLDNSYKLFGCERGQVSVLAIDQGVN